MQKIFSISIVSHGHSRYIEELIRDISRINRDDIEVILTLNLQEEFKINFTRLPFAIRVIQNITPKGFAANHNAAYALSTGKNFVILNPDIKLVDDPFDELLHLQKKMPDNIYAPIILNGRYQVEESARNFPSPYLLCRKLIGQLCNSPLTPEVLIANDDAIMPDWVAGMFIMIPRDIFLKLSGLNEKYYMYYEDVDLCARARLAKCKILVCKRAKVIHEAQHDSHKKLRYLIWHVGSAFRFFTSSAYLKISWDRIVQKKSKL
ncbi:hypothetical protein [Glaciimonas sp. PAMC28666]|uniref:hypothetical protein n=1 Tax=Glaciimonas sp. PAMC28666 TaxID=2807626 RepID=UPI0019623A93|nr:hypothetical protein [Glaciimonas sp. PAMC28666]QRX81017.1 hypothetical protein JQN73_12420 [Glaciimonas sp. PAMC28666]